MASWAGLDAGAKAGAPERILAGLRQFATVAADEDEPLPLRSGALFVIGGSHVCLSIFPELAEPLVGIAATLVGEGLLHSVESYTRSRVARDNSGLMCLDYVLQHALKPGGVDLASSAEGPTQAACGWLVWHIGQMAVPGANPHVLEAKSAAQALGRVAKAAGGKALLRRLPGLSEAMMWLLEHSGPIGKIHQIDPAAAAGGVLGTLFGGEEDAALALPEKPW